LTFAAGNIELLMSAAQSSLLFRRRFAWLLALVLLLPIAQTVATWHLLSHVHSVEAEHTDGDHAHQHERCDLCQLAEALTGGAAPVSSIISTRIEAPRVAPRIDSSHIRLAFPQRAYESRAPPFTPT